MSSHGGRRPVYMDPREPIETRIADLLQKMTLEEKVGQMSQYSGLSESHEKLVREGKVGSFLNVFGAEAINRLQRIAVEESRLGVPLLFAIDVIHGYSTIFPVPLGTASSWDPEMVKAMASVAAKEAASEGIRWTFAPMVDIARDPRWGRIVEGAGEDPYLGSAMARAQVEGFQGDNLAGPERIVACPKHFVAYGGAEGGRDYNTVDVSERTLRELYLPPFEASIVQAGALTVVCAFNDLNGVPATANRGILTTILRHEWGFEGFVVSDWNSIGELVNHGIAATRADAAKEAVSAGVDMDMQGNVYQENLARLVRERRVPRNVVDNAVKRILRVKFRMGLFDNPYTDPEHARATLGNRENVEKALQVTRESLVLLKNEGGLLPLRKDIESLAVIGPLADDRSAPLGSWSCRGNPKDVVTVLEGIRGAVSPSTKVKYAKGCDVEGPSTQGFSEAKEAAEQSSFAVIVLGEAAQMSGEGACRASLDLPGMQEKLAVEVHDTGTPVIEVLMNGRPLSIPWSAEHIPSIIEAWFPGVQGGNAIAQAIFGDYSPGGKLPVTFPRTVGQVPIFYNHKSTGRPPSQDKWSTKYLDVPPTPLFPFGHGLSYTKFEYSNLRVSPRHVGSSERIRISLDLENIGNRKGDEVVQVYVQDVVASVTRPVKELKDFKRVTLEAGEKRTLSFRLLKDQLSIVDSSMKRVVEPGTFNVMVGSSSEDVRLADSFEIMK